MLRILAHAVAIICLYLIVKLSRILGFWRRNRSALERRINNLWSVQGAE